MEYLRYIPDNLMSGPHVRMLQGALDALDYELGQYGADGWFGKATSAAVVEFQADHDLATDGIVGPATWAELEKAVEGGATTQPDASQALPDGFIDRRGLHAPPKLYSAHRSPRAWTKINGVTLHQTGCRLSDRPARWDTVGAHIGITRNGKVILMNELTDFIWHAQGLSHHTIGIEICGNYHGLVGEDWTIWEGGGGPHSLNADMMIALDTLFAWLQAEFERNGVVWSVVRAHRQSYVNRQGDPGEEIWSKVGLKWIRQLGIPQDPSWTTGSGRAIPESWGGADGVKY